MRIIVFLLIVILCCSCDLKGQKLISHPLTDISIPIDTGDKPLKPLMSLVDKNLQAQLIQKVNADTKLKRLVNNRKMAIGLVLLDDTSNIRYARINGNITMYAASLPKIAVLLAAMDAIENNEIEDTEALRNDMRLMIARSNNDATTRIIDLLGFEKIENVFRYKTIEVIFKGI